MMRILRVVFDSFVTVLGWVRDFLSFWMREIVGWLLVFASLGLFFYCFLLIQDRLPLEAGPLTIIGIVVFRGGIHLLKVSAAARICSEARQRSQDPSRRTA